MLQRIKRIVSQIQCKLDFTPEIGVVLGSGLDSIYESVDVAKTIPYSELEGMPISTAPGHVGQFIFGYISSRPVVLMRGRIHSYEGYSTAETTIPIRVMALLGIKYLLLSNAAGGVNPNFSVGDLMLITDHINFIPNPLIGPNIEEFGPRFPAMGSAYDKKMMVLAEEEAAAMGITLRKGVYVSLTGPSFETPSEYNFVRIIGGSAVGMSTTPEVIVASHMGLKVMAVSLISNVAFSPVEVSHEEVLRQSKISSAKMSNLFRRVISRL